MGWELREGNGKGDNHVWTYFVPSASQVARLWVFTKTVSENHHCHPDSQIRKVKRREVRHLAKVTQQWTLGSSGAGIPTSPAKGPTSEEERASFRLRLP